MIVSTVPLATVTGTDVPGRITFPLTVIFFTLLDKGMGASAMLVVPVGTLIVYANTHGLNLFCRLFETFPATGHSEPSDRASCALGAAQDTSVPTSVAPVSYTHLDVYKRQGQGFA